MDNIFYYDAVTATLYLPLLASSSPFLSVALAFYSVALVYKFVTSVLKQIPFL